MRKWLFVCGLSAALTTCSKESGFKPYAYLNVRQEGFEEDAKWETVSGTWIDSLKNADLTATGYYFGSCELHLQQISGTGAISPLTLKQFNYTDGVDLKPYAVDGAITITELSDKAVKGKFTLYLQNNYNGVAGRKLTGDFGIVNKP